jgi:hypothetical protein
MVERVRRLDGAQESCPGEPRWLSLFVAEREGAELDLKVRRKGANEMVLLAVILRRRGQPDEGGEPCHLTE